MITTTTVALVAMLLMSLLLMVSMRQNQRLRRNAYRCEAMLAWRTDEVQEWQSMARRALGRLNVAAYGQCDRGELIADTQSLRVEMRGLSLRSEFRSRTAPEVADALEATSSVPCNG